MKRPHIARSRGRLAVAGVVATADHVRLWGWRRWGIVVVRGEWSDTKYQKRVAAALRTVRGPSLRDLGLDD